MEALFVLVGSAMTLGIIFFWEKVRPRDTSAKEEKAEEANEAQEKLREQWANFLNYNGSDQNGY